MANMGMGRTLRTILGRFWYQKPSILSGWSFWPTPIEPVRKLSKHNLMLPFWAVDSHRLRALWTLIISSWINRDRSWVVCGATQKRLLSFSFLWFWFFRLGDKWRRAFSTQQLCKQMLLFALVSSMKKWLKCIPKGLCNLMLRVQLKTRRKRWFAPDWAFERKPVLSKGCLQLAKHWQPTTLQMATSNHFHQPLWGPLW